MISNNFFVPMKYIAISPGTPELQEAQFNAEPVCTFTPPSDAFSSKTDADEAKVLGEGNWLKPRM
jgi:hypothetical protein